MGSSLGMQKPPYQLAVKDFQRARTRAALQEMLFRLTGSSVAFLSYEEIAEKLHVIGRVERGVRQIPVAKIVGTVGRYQDFTRMFLPHLSADQDRWASVRAASASVGELPPISVYQVGDAYFVAEGNHRVSVARQQGLDYIDAAVIEVRTRVPLAASDSPDEIICKAEYAAFLESTQLDRLRPGAVLAVSVPGQYEHLENLIEVHRYFIEIADDVELTEVEAVCRWYDESYLPLVGAMREQGILRYLPGRTETDFYVWLARNQTLLQNELGWQIRPEVAVIQLSRRLELKRPESGLKRVYRRILEAVSLEEGEHWSRQRAMARYSDRLFADILVPVVGNEQGGWALHQAQVVAARERAQLCGLLIWPGEERPSDFASREATFAALCAEAGVSGTLGWAAGSAVSMVLRQSLLTDLIVVDRPFGLAAVTAEGASEELLLLLDQARRPVLVVPHSVSPLRHALLVYDRVDKAEEALFVAAYLGERWGTALTVLMPPNVSRSDEARAEHVVRYLELHEIEPRVFYAGGNLAEEILPAARAQACDFIIMGGPHGRFLGRGAHVRVDRVVTEWDLPLLVCS